MEDEANGVQNKLLKYHTKSMRVKRSTKSGEYKITSDHELFKKLQLVALNKLKEKQFWYTNTMSITKRIEPTPVEKTTKADLKTIKE